MLGSWHKGGADRRWVSSSTKWMLSKRSSLRICSRKSNSWRLLSRRRMKPWEQGSTKANNIRHSCQEVRWKTKSFFRSLSGKGWKSWGSSKEYNTTSIFTTTQSVDYRRTQVVLWGTSTQVGPKTSFSSRTNSRPRMDSSKYASKILTSWVRRSKSRGRKKKGWRRRWRSKGRGASSSKEREMTRLKPTSESLSRSQNTGSTWRESWRKSDCRLWKEPLIPAWATFRLTKKSRLPTPTTNTPRTTGKRNSQKSRRWSPAPKRPLSKSQAHRGI